MRWLDDITDEVNMNLSKLREMGRNKEAWHAAIHGVAKSWTWLGDWTATTAMSLESRIGLWDFPNQCFLTSWTRGSEGYLGKRVLDSPRGYSPPANSDIHIFMCVLSRVWLFATLWTVAHQAPLSIWFSRQEYWKELPFPTPGDLSDPGIEPASRTGRRVLYLWATREAQHILLLNTIFWWLPRGLYRIFQVCSDRKEEGTVFISHLKIAKPIQYCKVKKNKIK